MNPNWREQELQKTAVLLEFVYTQLNHKVPLEIVKASNDIYCNKDYTAALCSLIRSMDEDMKEKIIYNAHNRLSRVLASWWEEHEAADKERLIEEKYENFVDISQG